MAIVATVIKEARAVGLIGLRTIELAGFAFRCHAVALYVAKMGTRCAQLTRLELGDPRLDDDAALATRIKTSSSQSSNQPGQPSQQKPQEQQSSMNIIQLLKWILGL